MALDLTGRQRAFRDELRAFYAKHVEPGWRERCADFEELGRYLLDWERVLAGAGWSVPTWPAEHGGRDADAVERAIFTEETARFDAPEGLNRLGKRLVAPVLWQYGTPAQREHLERIRSGTEVWCQGFSEPDAGSDLVNIRTRAVRDGDEWVVDGAKIWTSFAQFADWIILLVRTGAADSRADGISVLLVDLRSPGIEISPIQTISGRSEFNEVSFSDVRVPVANLVGDENQGWAIVRSVLQDERGADYCLARYSDIRRILTDVARDVSAAKPASAVHYSRLGTDYARVYAIQVLASDLLERGQRGEAPEGLESLLKLYTTETWRTLGDDQVRVWGSRYFDGGPAERLHDYAESRHYTISAGTSEIQRNLIASRILALPSGRRKGA
ncbi:acyl-CoA dehydrogenase family protein [Amycolatopsis sp. Poz14]|uniref:acyl-CoA dehydrogenase family protein n=1 Tax=Amycolatopsis sp. Poz14 TaxID=1447705 RepID=UPI001EE8CEC0|nr:acyl-CoA dehydrogenase family protein [Amycolatopsis sp. Poz14]MCG3754016.1 acyl-CoA dehydrogenase family protein [Amycolatopsis sp. Poz14]